MYPSFHALPLQPRGQKRPRSNPIEWNDLEEWGADAGPAKAWKLKCIAKWERVLGEAIDVFRPPLLATCKPVVQIPKPLMRYEHKFCGQNFNGERDHSLMFIVEARRVLNAPGSKLTYTFTVKMSLATFPEENATQLLHMRMGKIGLRHETQVSLDAWRKEWTHQRALQTPEKDLEPLLAAAIENSLTGVLSPWLSFFATHFTYKEL